MDQTALSPNKIVDLHCHSSASDGARGKPADIAAFCKDRGYAAFALAEHETFHSLEAARKASKEIGIEYVPGIELGVSVSDPVFPHHSADILGYYYELTPELREIGRENETRFYSWIKAAIERLSEKGIVHVTEKELRDQIKTTYGEDDVWKQPYNLGPLYRVLVQKGVLDPNGNIAIRQFLIDHYPQSEIGPRVEATRACRVLRDAGAVVILAHPGYSTAKQPNQDERMRINHWLDHYVDGIEVYTPKHNPAYRDMLLDIVKERGRPYSGGTDAHGFGPSTHHSQAPYECLISIRDFLAKR